MRIYNKYSYGHYIVRFEVFLPIHATGFRVRSVKFSYFRDLRALGFFFFFFPPTLSQITNFWHAEPSCILLSKICQIPAFSVTQQILEPPVQKWIRRLMWIQNLDPPGGLGIEFVITSGSDQVMLDNKVLPVKQWLAQEPNQDRAKIAYHTPNGSINDSRDLWV